MEQVKKDAIQGNTKIRKFMGFRKTEEQNERQDQINIKRD